MDAPVSVFSSSCSLEPVAASLGPLPSEAGSGSVSGSLVLFLLGGPGHSPSELVSPFFPYSPLLWPWPYFCGGGALDLVMALFSRDGVWESPHSFFNKHDIYFVVQMKQKLDNREKAF